MGKKLISELTRILLTVFVIVALFGNINIVFAENYDWPTFHCDETRSGVTKEALKVNSLLEQWRYQTSSSISTSPIIVGNTVYIVADNRKLYAIDGESGEKKWETETFVNYPLPLGAPTYSNGKIYFTTGGSTEYPSYIYAYSSEGIKLWSFVVFGQISSSSALVYGNKIFVSASTDLLYCVNEAGVQEWQYGLNSPAYASPVIGAGRVFVVSGKGRVYAFDFNNLKSLFEIDLPLPSGSECKGTPAFSDGVLYVPTRTINGKGEIFAINGYTGEIIWKSGPIGNFSSSPAVNDKFVFIGSEENTFFAISKLDGKVKWKYGTKNRIISSPAVTGEYVIFASTDGFIYAASMDGNIVWQLSIGGEITTSPAVGYNKLIVTFSNTCVALSDSIDFSISADPANLSLYQGEEANIKIHAISTSSLAQNVFLRADKVPLGFEIIISPNILKLTNTEAVANLKLIVNKTVKEGAYSFDIVGETTGRVRKAKIFVEVLKISDGSFIINVNPQNASVAAGNAVVFMVDLSSKDGFIGAVNLSILNAPSGFTCNFSESRVEVPGITSLSILTDITMDPDKYSVAIQGKGGGKSEIVRISVEVTGTKRFDWLGYGNRDRITNCTDETVASSLELRYTFQAEGAIRSQPAIYKDTAYFTTEIQRATKHHATKLYAIDIRTGKLKWDYFLGISPTTLPDIGTETKDDPPPWISSPRIYGDKLFVGTLDGLLFCFNINTGKPIWYRNVGSSIRSSPCVGDDKVYFGTSNNKVYALDIESGEQRWMTELKGPIYSSPAFYNGRVYISSYDNNLYSLSSTNGLTFWAFNGFRSSFKASPVISENGDIYIGGAGENKFFYRVNPSGTMKWQILTEEEIPSTAALDSDGKFIYYIGLVDKGNLTLAEVSKVNVETKEKIWGYSAGGGVVTTSPVIAGDKIIFGGLDKNLNIIGTDGRLILKYLLDDKIQGSPSVGRGVVLAGTNSGKLYCFSSSIGFTLIPDKSIITIFQGGETELQAQVLLDMPLQSAIKFSLENVPAGVSYEFIPAELATTGNVILRLKVSEQTSPGRYKLIIVGTSGRFRRTTEIELRVQNQAPGKFYLKGDTLSKEANAGTTIKFEINIEATGGFNAPISFSTVNALPENVKVTFSPRTISPPGKVTMSVSIPAGLPPQTFQVVVKGDGGGKQENITFEIIVYETIVGDFVIRVVPTYLNIYLGEETNIEIYIDGFQGFNEIVKLSVDGLPETIKYSFDKIELNQGEKAILNIKTDFQLSKIGLYKFDIKGKALNTEKKVSVELEVTEEKGDFFLNLPSGLSLTGTAGEYASFKFTPTFSINWSAPVKFSIINLPTNVKATIEPEILYSGDFGKEISVLLKIDENSPTGIYELTIQGFGGGKIRRGNFKLQTLSTKSGFITLSIDPTYPQIKKDKETDININIDGAKDLVYIQFTFKWDPQYIKVSEIIPGSFMSSDGEEITFIKEIDSEKGLATVKISRNSGTGISGKGNLTIIKVVGVNKGTTKLEIINLSARITNLEPFPAKGGEISAIVTLFLAGDVNGDGTVDINDLVLFSNAFGAKKGDSNYDPRCDFNDDGYIDGLDLILLAYNWGENL